MKKLVEISNIQNDRADTIKVDLEIPSKCPVCSVAYGDEPLVGFRFKKQNGTSGANASTIFFCPHCQSLFNVNYIVYADSYTYKSILVDTHPVRDVKTEHSKSLSEMSPRFVNIYEQSEKAEAHGLYEICGMGYRKALEFLVKDFACMMNPEEEDDIKKLPLGACINKYIESKRIKTLATASAWLGNDETHYVKMHEDYDTEDMKIFIKSLVPFIESELAFLEAQEFIESKKK